MRNYTNRLKGMETKALDMHVLRKKTLIAVLHMFNVIREFKIYVRRRHQKTM